MNSATPTRLVTLNGELEAPPIPIVTSLDSVEIWTFDVPDVDTGNDIICLQFSKVTTNSQGTSWLYL